jgi:ELWxxDGT repeat protein
LTALGDELYFLARDADGTNAWRSDGTPAGTRQLTTSRRSSHAPEFARLGSLVFFLGNDPEDSSAEGTIWKTDGTAAGTALADLGGTDVTDLIAFGGALYFFATAETFPRVRQLMRSDGTAGGTVALHDFPPGSLFPATPSFLTPAGSQLFFTIDDEVHGTELWRSDGTASGTVLVRDILPGGESSRPGSLAAAAGKLYFSASDGVHGFELWESDGTEAGTHFVQDLAPEAESSFPEAAVATGNRLYWSADDGLYGRELWSRPLSGPTGCQASATRLCLNANRFQVEIEWRDFAGKTGAGTGVPLTSDTGAFWFFDPQNVEAIVKVIDGQAINQSFWVFYGALSNVEYTITVTDTQTGLTRRYFNPAGQFASVGDTGGFGPFGAYSARIQKSRAASAAPIACVPDPTRLCLNGGRFAVEAAWKDFQGNTGTGTAVALTPDTGFFWFFNPANVEVVTKVLDGRPLNGKFWFFYGALSNVEYTLTVTDTQTGKLKVYKNPQGRFASAGDTGAF